MKRDINCDIDMSDMEVTLFKDRFPDLKIGLISALAYEFYSSHSVEVWEDKWDIVLAYENYNIPTGVTGILRNKINGELKRFENYNKLGDYLEKIYK